MATAARVKSLTMKSVRQVSKPKGLDFTWQPSKKQTKKLKKTVKKSIK